jgi:hypothetical protein
MKLFAADIIVPVWNKPEKTRLCLAELVKHTPEARFILIDNASERETELLLHEFAEALGERALLFRNDKARESVAVVNMGLAKAEAPFVVLVDNSTVVGKGWLGTLLDMVSSRPDVGLAIPDIVLKKDRHPHGKKLAPVRQIEVSHGCFAAVLIRKSLYDRIGGFDESMDGGDWCLKDYSRRAWKEGFVTVKASGVTVFHDEDVPLGSPARREERVKESMTKFFSRWGEEQSFCVDMSGKTDPVSLRLQFETMLDCARRGCSYTVLAHRKTYREVVREGYDLLHKNIAVERLPFLFASGSADRVFSRLRKNTPNMKMITIEDQLACRICRVNGNSPREAKTLAGGPDA